MEQQSTTEEDAGKLSGRRVRWPWFPIIWGCFLASVVGVNQFREIDRDLKTVTCIAMGLLFLVGVSVWFTASGLFSRRARWGIVGLFWAAMFGIYQSVDIINDGDARWVNWQFVWQPKPDELLAVPDTAMSIDDWQTTDQDYPRFLGSVSLGGGYWAEVEGVRLNTDWKSNPPEELWRKEIGAGWSAFAIVGDYAFTQEQRGEKELVVCYRVSTGDIVWTHGDVARFDPATLGGGLGGVGPQATPTVHEQKVFTQGATGIVNCLDAKSGQRLWSHDVHEEFGADGLIWGKSGSPLVVDDMVVISVGAPALEKDRKSYSSSLVAFDIATGEVRWAAGDRITSYASPVLTTLAQEEQILQVNEDYLTSHRASDGQVLWEHEWLGKSDADASCAQPVPVGNDRLLLTRGYGTGSTLLQVAKSGQGEYKIELLWDPPIKRVMRTKFGNVVVRDGYVYGIDDVMLECMELETGKKMWRERRNPALGHGQIMLIGDAIVILSEIGELVLVRCTPERYEEVATMQVFEPSDVTWNNPAFSSPYLLLRNAREAVCLRMAVD